MRYSDSIFSRVLRIIIVCVEERRHRCNIKVVVCKPHSLEFKSEVPVSIYSCYAHLFISLLLDRMRYNSSFRSFRWLKNIQLYGFKLFFFLIYLYIYFFYFWLCWVFVSVRGLSPVAVSGPLTVAPSPVAEHRLQTRRLSICGSRA